MIKLKNIVLQMSEEDYQELRRRLAENRADKFHNLLEYYRENQLNDDEIAEKLKVTGSTYYTLKSRLHNRIQEILTEDNEGSLFNLLKGVANIPNLLYTRPREIAIAILSKLEKDLIEYDMPYELTNVYNAFKKLHVHSPKYYEYSQLYNKHVAYTVALDKAEDLLLNFTKTYGEYSVSHSKTSYELLFLIKREMANLCNLYKSHHLSIYQNIINVWFALFVPNNAEAVKDDKPVGDILLESETILKNFPKDLTYQHLELVFDFLYFEYYHKLGLSKNEAPYFEKLNAALPTLMLYNFCCFNSQFLLSKIELYLEQGQEGFLYQESLNLMSSFEPDKSDVPNYVNYTIFLAMSAFYVKKYAEAGTLLNTLLNDISLRSIPYAEIQIKLLAVLFQSMQNKFEVAESTLRSVARKIRELNKETGETYEAASILIKMLHIQLDATSRLTEQKLLKLRDKFETVNQGRTKMFGYLKFRNDFIKHFAKTIK